MTRSLHPRWWPLYLQVTKRLPRRLVDIANEQFFPPTYSWYAHTPTVTMKSSISITPPTQTTVGISAIAFGPLK
jgi:hypothetical protein